MNWISLVTLILTAISMIVTITYWAGRIVERMETILKMLKEHIEQDEKRCAEHKRQFDLSIKDHEKRLRVLEGHPAS